MHDQMRTLVVVPTHNEAGNIVGLLTKLRDSVPDVDVIVIDDASTDDTRALVHTAMESDPRLRIVERSDKRGLGDAYLHAFDIALNEGYDAVVEIDADHSHDPSVLPTMLDVARHGIALVIGSRDIPGGTVTGWPRRRTWLSRWGNRYVAIMLGLAINDATAGYRGLPHGCIAHRRPRRSRGERLRLPGGDDLSHRPIRAERRRDSDRVHRSRGGRGRR